MTAITKLLIANRGEIAIRIIRAAAELGIHTVAIYSSDDAHARHVTLADTSLPLDETGVPAYLDADQIIALALEHDCDALHPGYGFLSENADFARRCLDAGIQFVGPRPEILALFGDKTRARAQALASDLPILPGIDTPVTQDQAADFLASLGDGAAIMLKAISGGGGRGMRVVSDPADLPTAFARAQSEARAATGLPDIYVEQYLPSARHIEVQILGDGTGAVTHLGERECTIQRRHQKLIEIAPSLTLSPSARADLLSATLHLASDVTYDNIGTVEFLFDEAANRFYFLEVNPRLQVEHTVTDEVMGTDLVKIQLQLAMGYTLDSLGLIGERQPRGTAMQLRINMETIQPDGDVRPGFGTLTTFEPPMGAGIRVDTGGYTGYTISPHFDSLLAKLIISEPSAAFPDLLTRAHHALSEFHITGVQTNIPFLQAILQHPDFAANRLDTRFVETHLADLLDQAARQPPVPPAASSAGTPTSSLVNAAIDPELADSLIIRAPLTGAVKSVEVETDTQVHANQPLIIVEAMKMETVIHAPSSGVVQRIAVQSGDILQEGQPVLYLQVDQSIDEHEPVAADIDLDHIRPDLAEVHARLALRQDSARPEAVEKRHNRGQRTAWENILDLCDPDSFVEYGGFAIAAQRQRRSLDDLIANTPADGMITGVGSINGHLFDEPTARCIVASYDYTVLAGTQGAQNHRKKDRIFELAHKWKLPVILFSEGGGGRPGDTDSLAVSGLDTMAFYLMSRLKGQVPLVNITAGRSYAGNALLAGISDVIIATQDANLGMGGPAMIEGGGLGTYRPEEIGPADMQVRNGVVDILVADEAEAVQVAKQYLSYFQGPISDWDCADQRQLRHAVPENRLRVYEVRQIIDLLADSGSVLELGHAHAPGMITSFARIEGLPLGIVANNPQVLAGAITTDGAYKAARFMDLCNTFGIPLLSLCDTPGIMVGPEAEETGLVAAAGHLFVTGARLTVPLLTIVLRKCYGLGAMAMAGGTLKAPYFSVSWPTGEFGGMGLEGAVQLGFRRELDAVQDPAERQALYDKLVTQLYEYGKALSVATYFEIDDVIDPVDSRALIVKALQSLPRHQSNAPK